MAAIIGASPIRTDAASSFPLVRESQNQPTWNPRIQLVGIPKNEERGHTASSCAPVCADALERLRGTPNRLLQLHDILNLLADGLSHVRGEHYRRLQRVCCFVD